MYSIIFKANQFFSCYEILFILPSRVQSYWQEGGIKKELLDYLNYAVLNILFPLGIDGKDVVVCLKEKKVQEKSSI